jgi:signal transduction histidine kinase
MTTTRWSLLNRLTAGIGTAALLAWTASSIWLYSAAYDEANRLFDDALDNTANAVLAVVRNEASELNESKEGVGFELAVIDQTYDNDIVYQVRGPNGLMVFRSHGAPITPLARAHDRGFGYARIDGKDYRVYSLALELDAATIHVAQPIAQRIALAHSGALRLLAPGAALMVALVGVIAWTVRKTTAPVIRYANALDSLTSEAEKPVDGSGLPRELQSVSEAINRLMRRVHDSLIRERTLTADAAHELRNPLGAIRLQAQVARRAKDPKERESALDDLLSGTDRAARMVEAVLTLARFDASTDVQIINDRVQLDRLAELIASEFAVSATARGVVIRLSCEHATVNSDQDSLAILLRNLLSNALRHARTQICIEIRDAKQSITLAVLDDGPGFTEETAARAFHRFFRGPEESKHFEGAGLGLALVLRIAHLHSGSVQLEPGINGGAKVTVSLRRVYGVLPPTK